jgi:hypothetical protein
MSGMLFNGKLNEAEFYAWVSPPGMTAKQAYSRARLLGSFVEVDEVIYDHFLGVMPPMHWTPTSPFNAGGFAMCEATTDDLRLAFFSRAGRYFAAYVSDSDPSRAMAPTRALIVAELDKAGAL